MWETIRSRPQPPFATSYVNVSPVSIPLDPRNDEEKDKWWNIGRGKGDKDKESPRKTAELTMFLVRSKRASCISSSVSSSHLPSSAAPYPLSFEIEESDSRSRLQLARLWRHSRRLPPALAQSSARSFSPYRTSSLMSAAPSPVPKTSLNCLRFFHATILRLATSLSAPCEASGHLCTWQTRCNPMARSLTCRRRMPRNPREKGRRRERRSF